MYFQSKKKSANLYVGRAKKQNVGGIEPNRWNTLFWFSMDWHKKFYLYNFIDCKLQYIVKIATIDTCSSIPVFIIWSGGNI